MNQLAFTLPARLDHPPPRYPAASAVQLWVLLEALWRGERLTPIYSLEKYRVMALSQRVGEIRKLGWPVRRAMIATPTGKHVAEYWLEPLL